MEPIITVDHVSKIYSRNANRHLSYGMGDLLDELFGRKKRGTLRKDEFYAVNDVVLALDPGDTFALIGRNGSGKTTLLKMLNGLIKPDGGEIRIRGRVQAMINLGAGFAPSLSGRDNIYNSASLMGLNRRETTEILEEIVDFAELDEFIDSPVSTYSSGMKARLGFAVAVHLKPDILLIDEILSVGDFAFQNKCYTKMQQLKKDGVSIVLVSHSHPKVLQLCDKALWLHNGKTMQMGAAGDTVKAYLDFLEQIEQEKVARENEKREKAAKQEAPRSAMKANLYGPVYDTFDRIEDLSCELLVNGAPVESIPVHSNVVVRYRFRLKEEVQDLHLTLNFFREDGVLMAAIATLQHGTLKHIHSGEVCCEVSIPDFDFTPGTYVLMMPICEGKSYLYRDVVKRFTVNGEGGVFWGMKDFRCEYRVLSHPKEE